MFMY